jgi:antitoxin component YwqK of YwqJK toxin-antitoxin module
MKKKGLIYILLLFFVSCGIERYDDGSKLFKFYYLNGNLKKTQLQKPNEGTGNGYWKYYDEDGDITKEFQISDGKPTGIVKFYWKNGNLKVEEFINNGLSSGRYVSFYENGHKEYQGEKTNGKFEGIWWHFNEEGDTLEESFYKNGELVWEQSIE